MFKKIINQEEIMVKIFNRIEGKLAMLGNYEMIQQENTKIKDEMQLKDSKIANLEYKNSSLEKKITNLEDQLFKHLIEKSFSTAGLL
jgi:predicted nuclease with TOPRIM domain